MTSSYLGDGRYFSNDATFSSKRRYIFYTCFAKERFA